MFKEAKNLQAFLKCGIYGFAGSGKTFTASLIAKGIYERLKLGNGKEPPKPIYFLDTETGSDFLAPRFEEWQIPFFVSKSRAFKDLIKGVQMAEKEASVLIIDSVSHYWKELLNAYSKAKNRKRILFQDWAYLKDTWAQFTDLYLNTNLHIIVCGRAGYEYDYFQDESGSKQLERTGTKMKAEGEMSYEPSLLLEMVREKKANEDGSVEGQMWDHTAYVLKDRSQILEGKKFRNPTFKDLEPVFNYLNIGGEHCGVNTENDSSDLFDKDNDENWAERRKHKEIVLEEIQGEITAAFPGQSVAEKKAKADIVYDVFKTRSWTRVTELHLEELQEGLESVKARIKSMIEEMEAQEA